MEATLNGNYKEGNKVIIIKIIPGKLSLAKVKNIINNLK